MTKLFVQLCCQLISVRSKSDLENWMVDFSDIAQRLETPLVRIGTDTGQRTQMGMPFPLVLSPAEGNMNFIQLQEYFMLK